MRVTILQPTYWARAHVWNRVLRSDVFVWLDSVKFSRSSTKWEDRTVVESRDGRPIVLRLPLRGPRSVLWREAGLNEGWQQHRKTLQQCYARRPYWAHLGDAVDGVYASAAATIDAVCWRSFRAVAGLLNPSCQLVRSSELGVTSAKGRLVLDLVQAVGGGSYLTGGPGAGYLDREAFAAAGVEVEVQDWKAPVSSHGLANPSVLHLLAEHGPAATRWLLLSP